MSCGEDDLCVVCFRRVSIYSVGRCDHPVCFECSTRMRVLCNQNECPICRTDMPEVIFTRTVCAFRDLVTDRCYSDDKHGLQFVSRSVRDEYLHLLQNHCQICVCMFRTFAQLRDHMRRAHELFYCDLCVDNLKIFTSERSCYTRADLARHRRKGDEDNKSHRGHPLCEFCDERYMDNDDLFRHLRRDHLYCHFCDADGKHQYYPDYHELRKHFIEEHFLCEEGDCKNELLTAAFRTDIDYRAHVATNHSKQLSRAAARQARTLELEFNFAPRRADFNRHAYRQSQRDVRELRDQRQQLQPKLWADEQDVGGKSGGVLQEQDFPTLGNAPPPKPQQSVAPNRTSATLTCKVKPKFKKEEFPSLGAAGAHPQAKPSLSSALKSSSAREAHRPGMPTASLYKSALAVSANTPAPSKPIQEVKLSINSKEAPQRSNVSISVNEQAPGRSSLSIELASIDAFPALAGAPSAAPEKKSWGASMAKNTQEVKPTKVAKAPVLPSSSMDEFPKLAKKEKKSSSVTMPIKQAPTVQGGAVKKTPAKLVAGQKYSKVQGKKGNDNARVASKGEQAEVGEVNDNVDEIAKKTSTLEIGTLDVQTPSIINDLTFTNSNGESFHIAAMANNNAGYTYISPENFQQRNTNLAVSLCDVFASPSGWVQFKTYSGLFRSGDYAAEKYYEYCREVMGEKFLQLFPELLALLPDIARQVDLFNVFRKEYFRSKLIKCAICGQVVYVYELSDHQDVHSAGFSFPMLQSTISGSSLFRRQF